MTTMPSDSLKSNIALTQEDVTSAAQALDKLIFGEANISYDLRLMLIHLQSAARRQNLLIDLMANELDHLRRLHDIVMEHLKSE